MEGNEENESVSTDSLQGADVDVNEGKGRSHSFQLVCKRIFVIVIVLTCLNGNLFEKHWNQGNQVIEAPLAFPPLLSRPFSHANLFRLFCHRSCQIYRYFIWKFCRTKLLWVLRTVYETFWNVMLSRLYSVWNKSLKIYTSQYNILHVYPVWNKLYYIYIINSIHINIYKIIVYKSYKMYFIRALK